MSPDAADMLVLRMLGWDFRIAVREQLVRVYRAGGVGSPAAARRRIRRLAATGLLGHADVLARPLLDLRAPLYEWTGEGHPDYSLIPQLAHTLERRWQQSLSATRVYHASRKALNVLGGVTRGAVKHYGQISHDLHCTEVAIGFLERDPGRMAGWVNEDANTEHVLYAKVPDTIFYDIESDPPRPVQAVEVGGFYPEEKIHTFFRDMERRRLAFSLY